MRGISSIVERADINETAYVVAIFYATEFEEKRRIAQANSEAKATAQKLGLIGGGIALLLVLVSAAFYFMADQPLIAGIFLVLSIGLGVFAFVRWRGGQKAQKVYAPKQVALAKGYWRLTLFPTADQQVYVWDTLGTDQTVIDLPRLDCTALRKAAQQAEEMPPATDNARFIQLRQVYHRLQPTYDHFQFALIRKATDIDSSVQQLLTLAQDAANFEPVLVADEQADPEQIRAQIEQVVAAIQHPLGVTPGEVQAIFGRVQSQAEHIGRELRQNFAELAARTPPTGDPESKAANPPVAIPTPADAIKTMFDQVINHLQAEVSVPFQNLAARQKQSEAQAEAEQRAAQKAAEDQRLNATKVTDEQLHRHSEALAEAERQVTIVNRGLAPVEQAVKIAQQKLKEHAEEPNKIAIQIADVTKDLQTTEAAIKHTEATLRKLTPQASHMGQAALQGKELSNLKQKAAALRQTLQTLEATQKDKGLESLRFDLEQVQPLLRQLEQQNEKVATAKDAVKQWQDEIADTKKTQQANADAQQQADKRLKADSEQQQVALKQTFSNERDQIAGHIDKLEQDKTALRRQVSALARIAASSPTLNSARKTVLDFRRQAIDQVTADVAQALQQLSQQLEDVQHTLTMCQWSLAQPPTDPTDYLIPLWFIKDQANERWQLFLAGPQPVAPLDANFIHTVRAGALYKYLAEATAKLPVVQKLTPQVDLNTPGVFAQLQSDMQRLYEQKLIDQTLLDLASV